MSRIGIVVMPTSGQAEAEEELRSAFRNGIPLDLARSRREEEAYQVFFADFRKTIRAEVIRELLLSDTRMPPGRIRQLSITGAFIVGRLDLSCAVIDCPISFTHCTFSNVVKLTQAHLRSVSMRHCTIPGIDGEHVSVSGDLDLRGARLRGRLNLYGAHLDDDLHLAKALINPSDARARTSSPPEVNGNNAALNLANISIKGNLDADRLTVYGKVSMVNARVGGSVKMTGATVAAMEGTDAWDGDGMRVEADVDATALKASGMVRLINAQVLVLVLRGIHIENSGTALMLDRLESRGSVFCDGGAQLHGGMQAIGMKVNATLYLDGMQTWSPQGQREAYSVNLCRAKITGDLRFKDQFRAVGRVGLTDARIDGQVLLPDATFRAAESDLDHVAFAADRTEIAGDLCASGEFSCVGTMRLINARIGGELSIEHDKRNWSDASALVAPGVHVNRSLTVRTVGTVDLSDAEVTGDIHLDLRRLTSDRDIAAADLSSATATVLYLDGHQRNGRLDLTRASVRRLFDDPATPPSPDALVLDGFEYSEIGKADTRYRLAWLKAGTRQIRHASGGYQQISFTPQPYTQLAATYRTAGLHREARSVLCHMHREQNHSVTSWHQWYSKLWNYAQDWALGYGYVPARALLWLLGLAVLASLWFTYADPKHVSIIRSAIISLSLVLPGSGYEKIQRWVDVGVWSQILGALLVLAGLLLGATVIAAVARIIKQ